MEGTLHPSCSPAALFHLQTSSLLNIFLYASTLHLPRLNRSTYLAINNSLTAIFKRIFEWTEPRNRLRDRSALLLLDPALLLDYLAISHSPWLLEHYHAALLGQWPAGPPMQAFDVRCCCALTLAVARQRTFLLSAATMGSEQHPRSNVTRLSRSRHPPPIVQQKP